MIHGLRKSFRSIFENSISRDDCKRFNELRTFVQLVKWVMDVMFNIFPLIFLMCPKHYWLPDNLGPLSLGQHTEIAQCIRVNAEIDLNLLSQT